MSERITLRSVSLGPYDNRMSRRDFTILLEICFYCRRNGYGPTVRWLANRANCSYGYVHDVIQRLTLSGLVAFEEKSYGTLRPTCMIAVVEPDKIELPFSFVQGEQSVNSADPSQLEKIVWQRLLSGYVLATDVANDSSPTTDQTGTHTAEHVSKISNRPLKTAKNPGSRRRKVQ